MIRIHRSLKQFILKTIDFFYPWFKKIMPLQTFRYAVCGGSNMGLSVVLFAFFYNMVYKKQLLHLSFITISPSIAAFLSTFCFTFPIGFYLSMFVVFPGSQLRRRIQLTRYFLVAIVNILLNYFLLKVFVEIFHIYPTPAYILNVLIVVTFTYFSQRYFSFKKED